MNMFELLPLLLCASTLALPNSKPFYDLQDAVHHFEQYIEEYNRMYAGEAEKQMRFELFKQSLEEINRRNMMEDEHATFGIDHFADMSQEEKKSYNGLLPTSIECQLLLDGGYRSRFQSHNEVPPASCEKLVVGDEWSDVASDDLPDSFDWRDKNVVSAVKNQLSCGSCWTFSSTGNIEGQYALKHGNIVKFSEQQLIDCNKFNHGCNGGLLNNSFGDLIANGGIMTEEDYPYEGQEKACRFNADKAKAKFTKCYSLDLQNEDKLKGYLYKTGPLSIAINADPIMGYAGGVLKNCDSKQINHGVLLVGWGTEGNLPYWTIKNSWAERWGEKGYFRILRGKNSCGLMNPCAATSVLA